MPARSGAKVLYDGTHIVASRGRRNRRYDQPRIACSPGPNVFIIATLTGEVETIRCWRRAQKRHEGAYGQVNRPARCGYARFLPGPNDAGATHAGPTPMTTRVATESGHTRPLRRPSVPRRHRVRCRT